MTISREHAQSAKKKMQLLRELAREGSPIALQTHLREYEETADGETPALSLTEGQKRRLMMKASRRAANRWLDTATWFRSKEDPYATMDCLKEAEKYLGGAERTYFSRLMTWPARRKLERIKPEYYPWALRSMLFRAYREMKNGNEMIYRSDVEGAVALAKEVGYDVKKYIDHPQLRTLGVMIDEVLTKRQSGEFYPT